MNQYTGFAEEIREIQASETDPTSLSRRLDALIDQRTAVVGPDPAFRQQVEFAVIQAFV